MTEALGDKAPEKAKTAAETIDRVSKRKAERRAR
jgi:hypothetical protein